MLGAVSAKSMRVGRPGDRLVDPRGHELLFVMTPSASDGRRLEMEWTVPPGERLVAADHYHPDGPEIWRVLAGSAGYRLDGEEHIESAPHEFEVPASTPHGHPWNAGDDVLVVRQIIAAPEPMPELTGGVQGFFETTFAFAQRGEVNERGDIGGRLQNTLTIYALLVPGTFLAGPPRWAQRALLGGLATVARATGKKPYARPEFAEVAGSTVLAPRGLSDFGHPLGHERAVAAFIHPCHAQVQSPRSRDG
ncbi:MAG: cupin domain-containing protein [Actinomycetota bacterium]